jgi:Flp pilus assembly pilin Flp
MAYVVRLVSSFRHTEDGQDLLEYALLISLIALVAVAAVTSAGLKWIALYDAVAAAIPA